jgi:hypothetical protein
VFILFNDFEKALYKQLFDLFSNEEYHVEFKRDSYTGDFEELRKAVIHLDKEGILYLLGNDPDSIFVELTENYCYDFAKL